MPDDDNLSELLDDDKLPDSYPPDEPLGVNQYGITAAEEEIDEPLEERVTREVPDDMPTFEDSEEGRPVGVLVEPGDGILELDTEADAVATEIFGEDETLGDVAQEREGTDLSAEEAAMHITAAPPMGDGDGYLEDE